MLQFGASALVSLGLEVAVKSILSLVTGSPGLPRPRGPETLRGRERQPESVRGQPGRSAVRGVGESVPPPENPVDFSGYSNALAPTLADAAADPRSLHAFGSRGRLGTTFLGMDIVPGDGIVRAPVPCC